MAPRNHMTQDSNRGKEQCFVAFLDILGFKEKVLVSEENPEMLETLFQSLKIASAIPTRGKKISNSSGEERTIQLHSRFFSDTVVFFLKENPNDIAHLFFVIRYLQDQLWQRGICLRGSIVLESMYWMDRDENITLGKGLIEAHRLESKIAIYPRIIVSEELCGYIERQRIDANPFGTDSSGLLAKFIRRDFDGIHFLDLLHHEVVRTEDERLELINGRGRFSIRYYPNAPSKHSDVLGSVDKIAREMVNDDDERVRQKGNWLQIYRNIHGEVK